jgi:hypothetical protein
MLEEKTRATLRAGMKVGAFAQRNGGNIKSNKVARRNFPMEHLVKKIWFGFIDN